MKEVTQQEASYCAVYSSRDIIRQIKSRRVTWAGYVARIGEERKVYKVLVRKPEGRDNLEDQGVDGRIGSEWILGRFGGGGVTWIPLRYLHNL
jgi:hypothetical protein